MKKILLTLFSMFVLSNVYSQNVGIGTNNPLQKLHISGTTNTLRIEGLKSTGSFYGAPSATTDRMVFVDVNGDFRSIPTGGSGNVLTVDGSGIVAWAAPATNGTVTSFSSGNLSPLFTTSVSNSGTTPGLSFTLSSVANGNYVYASPNGGAGTPSFRALVAADIPSLSSTYVDLTNAQTAAGAKTWSGAGSFTATGTGLSVTNNATIGGTLTMSSLTLGSVPFVGASGLISQSNSNFFWDATNNRLGIGTIVPSTAIHAVGTIRATTGFSANDGTLGSPSHYFTSETSLGMYRVGAGQLGFTVNALKMTLSTTRLNLANTVDLAPNNLPGTSTAAATINNSVSNYLQSAGAGASPVWVQPVSKKVIQLRDMYVSMTSASGTTPSNSYFIYQSGTGFVQALFAAAIDNSGSGLNLGPVWLSEGPGVVMTSTGTINKIVGTVFGTVAGRNFRAYAYKYTPVNGSTTAVTPVALGNVSVTMTNANAVYSWEIDPNIAVAKGDVIVVYYGTTTTSAATYSISGTIEVTTNVQ